MTCIVAVTDGQRIVLGADSVGVGPKPYHQIRRDPKIFAVGNFLLGFTTSFRMGQVLMHSEFPEPPVTDDPTRAFRFMVREFVPAARGCLEAGGYAKTITFSRGEAQESHLAQGGTFIVGFDGFLFEVHDDYAVAMQELPYTAIGAAHLPALGALAATADLDLSLEARARLALQAAATHTGACRSPFRFLSQDRSQRATEMETLPALVHDGEHVEVEGDVVKSVLGAETNVRLVANR